MVQLSPEAFEKARGYIHQNGRTLDRALFAYFFERGPKEDVLEELAKYQNEDGGFGHGLEPDFFYEGSSSMATSIAFQYLHQLDVPAEHELVRSGIRYLLETVDRDQGQWRRVPLKINQAPHAPWWHQEEEMEAYSGNATAEIIGYLHKYHTLVPSAFLESVTDKCFHYLEDQDELEMHEFLCFLRMADHLPERQQQQVIRVLKQHAPSIMETDPNHWGTYCLQPLQAIDSPQSPLYDSFQASMEHNLDYQIQHQTPLGCWDPHWSWPEDPTHWEIAKQHWRSFLTVDYLKKFEAFGRIQRAD